MRPFTHPGARHAFVMTLIFMALTATFFVFQTRHLSAVQPIKAAIFDFELIDTSLEGEKRGIDPAETARLKKISNLLRRLLAQSARFKIVPVAPLAKDIRAAGYIHGCNGCDADFAKRLGAEIAITGEVHKVSTLILNIRIFVRNAKTGALERVMNADIRGNTDNSWTHGVSWLVRHRLLAQ